MINLTADIIITAHDHCPLLTDPANGMVAVTGQASGFTATYTCNSGFELLDLTPGSDIRTCQPNGTWSGSEPQCIGKSVMYMYSDNYLFCLQPQ